jgi:hypothetical protein
MNRFAANAVGVAAVLFGGGSLVLLGGFLLFGSFGFIRFSATDAQVLLWDAGLSLLFFIQHSGMVRRSFRTWLDPLLARSFHAAVYALASGLVLVTVLLFWQPSATVLWALPAPLVTAVLRPGGCRLHLGHPLAPGFRHLRPGAPPGPPR